MSIKKRAEDVGADVTTAAVRCRRRTVRLLKRLRTVALAAERRPFLRAVLGERMLNTEPDRMAWSALCQAGYYYTPFLGPQPEWVSAIDRAIASLEAQP